jgi:hypothetical protein
MLRQQHDTRDVNPSGMVVHTTLCVLHCCPDKVCSRPVCSMLPH